jgi:hypothetical protein
MGGRPQRRARLAAGLPAKSGNGTREAFAPGNEMAVLHGAFSEGHVKPVARTQRRRALRRFGIRASDLDPVGRALLAHYCALAAKAILIDAFLDEVGVVDAHGQPQPCMKVYVQLHRAALTALARLETHLDRKARSLEEQLAELRRDA